MHPFGQVGNLVGETAAENHPFSGEYPCRRIGRYVVAHGVFRATVMVEAQAVVRYWYVLRFAA